jgi:hypothetical protein
MISYRLFATEESGYDDSLSHGWWVNEHGQDVNVVVGQIIDTDICDGGWREELRRMGFSFKTEYGITRVIKS